jgi:hypothetical protein
MFISKFIKCDILLYIMVISSSFSCQRLNNIAVKRSLIFFKNVNNNVENEI